MESHQQSQNAQEHLIDLHCHILPDLDDGCSLTDSLAIAKKAVFEENIGHIVATPKHFYPNFMNRAHDVAAAVVQLRSALKKAEIPLKVYAGQEVLITPQLGDNLNDLLGLDSGINYLLVDFPKDKVPDYVAGVFEDLFYHKVIPIIAHPELNHSFYRHPELLYQFILNGALAQLNTSSLIGLAGRKIQRFAEALVTHGLVHIIASDMHVSQKNDFNMRAAYFALDDLHYGFGPQFYQNSRQIINGLPINHEIELQSLQKSFWGY